MASQTKELRLAKSISIVFLASVIRLLLGCLRIGIVAFLFGATAVYDAYLVAFTIPEMIAELLVSVVAITFIPIFTDHLVKDGEAKAYDFAVHLINLFLVIGFLLIAVMIITVPFVVRLAAPGFNPETSRLAVRLIIIIFPLVLILPLAELVTRILNSYQRFAVPSLSRILEVMSVILSLVFLYKKYGIYSLAYGLLLGALIRLVFQLPFLWEKFKYYQFNFNFHLPGIRKVMLIAGPLISCMIFLRIGTVIERLLASTLKEGSISILGYATTLTQVPGEILLGSLGVVLFPLISQYASEGKIVDFKAILSKGIRMGNFILVPIAILFIFFGKPIIQSLLERGQFIGSMTQGTSIALAVNALGLLAMSVLFFSTQACYALQEIKITIKIAIWTMALNIVLKLILINYLSFAGLALATSITLIVQSGFLVRFLIKKIGAFDGKIIVASSIKILGASILMTIICWLVLGLIPPVGHHLLRLAVLVVTAGFSYFVFSFLLRSQELALVKDLFKRVILSSV